MSFNNQWDIPGAKALVRGTDYGQPESENLLRKAASWSRPDNAVVAVQYRTRERRDPTHRSARRLIAGSYIGHL